MMEKLNKPKNANKGGDMSREKLFVVAILLAGIFVLYASAQVAPDRFPPCVRWGTPPESPVPPDFVFTATVCDQCSGAPVWTGVSRERLHIFLQVPEGVTPVDITDLCSIEPNIECAGFNISFAISGFYVSIPAGTRIRFVIDAYDNAGNHAEFGASYIVQNVTRDTDPPCFRDWNPPDGAGDVPVTASLSVVVCDLCALTHGGASGVNPDSVFMWVQIGENPPANIPREALVLVPVDCAGYAVTYHPVIEFPPSTRIRYSVTAYDLAGNVAVDTVSFTTAGVARDTIPPCVREWRPDPPIIPVDSVSEVYAIGASICDNCSDASVARPSGVNRETIRMVAYYRGDSLNLTPMLRINENLCAGYDVLVSFYYINLHLRPGPGDSFEVCISASDNARNPMRACHTYIYGEPRRDIYPPCIYGWVPATGDSGVSTATGISVNVCDVCPTGETPFASGISRDSIRFSVRIGTGPFEDVTDLLAFHELDCYGYHLEYHPMIEFPPATLISACVRAVDNAGNVAEGCTRFYTEGTIIPPDTLPPNIGLTPVPGETLLLRDAFVRASICDNPIGPPGVDPRSIEMILNVDGVSIDVTERLIIEPNRCFGYEVTLPPIEEYRPGSYVVVNIGASDYAHNRAHARTEFYIRGETPIDTLPPCITRFLPESGDTVPVDVTVYITVCDICGDFLAYPSSGINPDSIRIVIFAGGVAHDVTRRAIITPNSFDLCNGFDITLLPIPEIYTPDSWITVSVRATDMVGHPVEAAHRLFLRSTIVVPDRFPPCITEWHPDPYLDIAWPPDVEIRANVCDNCDSTITPGGPYTPSGVDPSSIRMTIRINDGEPVDVTEHLVIAENDCYGVRVSFYPPDGFFHSGDRVRVVLRGADHSGNVFEGVNNFTIWEVPPDTTDITPPCVVEWSPVSGIVDTSIGVTAHLCDICGDEVSGRHSGVDPASIRAMVLTASDSFDVTEFLRLEENRCLGYAVHIPGWVLREDFEEFAVCVEAADYAGNSMHECHDFRLSIPPDTLDITPPCFTHWSPEDGESDVPVTTGISVGICDVCEGAGGRASGVNPERVTMTIRIGDGEWRTVPRDLLTFAPIYCAGYVVSYHPMIEFPPGTSISYCVEAYDFAGNRAEGCATFHTAGGIVTDITPPVITGWWPDTIYIPPSHIDYLIAGFSTCDLSEEGEIPSGVDPMSFVITIAYEGPVPPPEPLPYTSEPNRCWGYEVTFRIPVSYVIGDTIPINVEFADNAGNRAHGRHIYIVARPPVPVDTLPPYVRAWEPASRIIEGPVSAIVCDNPSGYTSGVDPSTIRAQILILGDTLPPAGDLIIRPYEECYYVTVPIALPISVVWDSLTVCLQASDYAGNRMNECETFYNPGVPPETLDTTPPCVTAWYPPDDIYRPSPEFGSLGASLCDICDATHPGHPSGVNIMSLRAWIRFSDGREIDITRFARYERNRCMGYEVYFVLPITVPMPADPFELCLEFADNAGNSTRACHRYNEGGMPGDTLDTTPPCVRGWRPAPGSEVLPDVTIGAMVCDLCTSTRTDFASGVNPSSLRMTITIEHGGIVVYRDVTSECRLYGIDCMGYSMVWEHRDLLPTGFANACVYGSDFAGNTFSDCVHFTITGSVIDTLPPVIGDWNPPDSSRGVSPGTPISATVCGGVDSASVRMIIYNSRGDSIVLTPWLHFTRIPCDGWEVVFYSDDPGVIFDEDFVLPGEWVTVILTASDFDGRTTTSSVHYRIVGFGPIAHLIEPHPGSFVSCSDADIVISLADSDGIDTTSIVLEIEGVEYTIESPNLHFVDNTLVFSPTEPWAEGAVHFALVSASDIYGNPLENPFESYFTVDRTPPVVTYIRPAPNEVIPSPPTAIAVGLSDAIAGVDRTLTYLLANGIPYSDGSPGFRWTEDGFIVYLREAGIIITPGDSFRVCVHSADRIDHCMPNALDTCYIYFIAPPRTHTLTGFVRDARTGSPLGGIEVRAMRRFHEYDRVSFRVDTTDARGYFELTVPDGEYILGAFPPPISGYRPQFFDHKPDPLVADVIRLTPASPETLSGFNFDLIYISLTRYRVSGRVIEADPDDGGIRRAFVIAVPSDEGEDHHAVFAMTDDEGYYELMLAPGAYYIFAFHPLYIPEFYSGGYRWDPEATLEVGSDISGVDFALTPIGVPGGLFFGGRVLEGPGIRILTDVPVAGAQVVLVDPRTDSALYVSVTDQDGYFTFEDIAPRVYRLVATKPLYQFAELEQYMALESSAGDRVYYMSRYTGIPARNTKPSRFEVKAYPNPFNSQVTIDFALPNTSTVRIEIYDVMGHRVKELGGGKYQAGRYVAFWDGKGDDGRGCASGVYFVSIRTENANSTLKVLYLK